MLQAAVIGGSRFIGPVLIKALLDRGYSVLVLNRGTRDLPVRHTRLQQVRGDRNITQDLHLLLEYNPSIVFDTCCYNHQQARAAVDIFCGRIERYVYISTIAVYQAPQSFPIEETAPTGPWPLWGDYGTQKAWCDQVFLDAFQNVHFPVTILRPTYVLGENNHVERETFFINRILAGIPVVIPADGSARLQFTFVRDVVQALLLLAETAGAEGEVFNCACDEAIPLVDLVQLFGRLLGRSVEVILADPGEFHYSTSPYWPVELSPFASADVVVSNEKIKRICGFVPSLFIEELASLVAWYRQQGVGQAVRLRTIELEVLSRRKWLDLSQFQRML